MVRIMPEHVGKKVRIQGIIPLRRDDYVEGIGNYVGVIRSVSTDGRKFQFSSDNNAPSDRSSFLNTGMWRIQEIIDAPIDQGDSGRTPG